MSNNRLGSDKTVEEYARAARRAGWSVTITGKNHVRWGTPDGKANFVCALTFGDPRRIKKLKKFLVSHGLVLDK